MKNEKVCINKSIAFVTAIVVLLLGVVLFANYMNSQNYATGSKAAPPAPKCTYNQVEVKPAGTTGATYTYSTTTFCITNVSTTKLVGARCQYTTDPGTGAKSLQGGNAIWDSQGCPVPSLAPRSECQYGGSTIKTTSWTKIGAVSYKIDGSGCMLESKDNGTTSAKNGLKCNSSTQYQAEPDSTNCARSTTPRSKCQYGGTTIETTSWTTIGAYAYKVDGSGCLLQTQDGGTTTKKMGLKCNSSTGYAALDDSACDPSTSRTACEYGGKTLSTTAWVQNGTRYYRIDASGCIMESTSSTAVSGSKIGLKCNTSTGYKAVDDDACAPTTAARTACEYGGKTISTTSWIQNGVVYYKIDGSGCMLEASSSTGANSTKNGLKCNSSTNYRAVEDDACEPVAATRTTCLWGNVELAAPATAGTAAAPTYGTAVTVGNASYALESPSGCIVNSATKLNNGYYCDANNRSSYNTTLCPNK